VLDALSATNPFLRAKYHWRHPRRHIILTGSLDHLSVHSFVHEVRPSAAVGAPLPPMAAVLLPPVSLIYVSR
jgi:hypothetical protein